MLHWCDWVEGRGSVASKFTSLPVHLTRVFLSVSRDHICDPLYVSQLELLFPLSTMNEQYQNSWWFQYKNPKRNHEKIYVLNYNWNTYDTKEWVYFIIRRYVKLRFVEEGGRRRFTWCSQTRVGHHILESYHVHRDVSAYRWNIVL